MHRNIVCLVTIMTVSGCRPSHPVLDLRCDTGAWPVGQNQTTVARGGSSFDSTLAAHDLGRVVFHVARLTDGRPIRDVPVSVSWRPEGATYTSVVGSNGDPYDTTRTLSIIDAHPGIVHWRSRCPSCWPGVGTDSVRRGQVDTLFLRVGIARDVCDTATT